MQEDASFNVESSGYWYIMINFHVFLEHSRKIMNEAADRHEHLFVVLEC